MTIRTLILALSFSLFITHSSATAQMYSYGDNNTVIGTLKNYKVKANESLIEIARKFKLGYNEIVDVNPDLDPFVPGEGKPVTIPTLWILPDVPYEGIVINLSEMRLYYFFKKKNARSVLTFPTGIGDEGTDTPLGNFKVIEKTVKPSWYVPESIRKEKPHLPKVVPPGPENPLGSHALRLSRRTILIHGTNKPWGVGRRVSHGCIRLYPEDIPELFRLVPKGTKVTIVRQPLKVGLRDKRVYVEVHKDDQVKNFNYFREATQLLIKKKLIRFVNTDKLYKAMIEKKGIPVDISNGNLGGPKVAKNDFWTP
ncbi:MAG: LysM peptidoglycan-binding domain-containing protein [Nitrospira sp.]|nr:LysM peptidoglycan-binding domain-containing protein [Nitrospira sp.]